MDVPLWVLGHNPVHEVEELDALAAAVVFGADLAGGNIEGGKQRGGAVLSAAKAQLVPAGTADIPAWSSASSLQAPHARLGINRR